jgi:UDP-glucose 4-epimerase
MDLAGGHVNALDAIEKDSIYNSNDGPGKFKAYNLGRGVGLSVLQMIEAMKKVSGYGYPHDVVGRRNGDVPDLTADPALAEKELGFKAVHGLDDMSRDQWNWQSNNPDGYGEE